MTVSVNANIHFNEDDVWHRWHPGDDLCHAYGALKFSESATLFFDKPAMIDKVIAELVALKQEMDPPKPPSVMCECGHFEACHVGAVLGDPDPGQCTAMVDDGDDCECERFRPAAAKAEPASTAPARTVSA